MTSLYALERNASTRASLHSDSSTSRHVLEGLDSAVSAFDCMGKTSACRRQAHALHNLISPQWCLVESFDTLGRTHYWQSEVRCWRYSVAFARAIRQLVVRFVVVRVNERVEKRHYEGRAAMMTLRACTDLASPRFGTTEHYLPHTVPCS
ncbi:hypothetical protein K431DRAFT_53254 [Polychaeton citri CBS 116435]|uniref:Uncharacterized protein n=1 Tax=Polychaeton citri CBS 116435 TaxID=1314669 RepID=A0A9P4UUJ2_9PEZI|nr:hypothetical protein K431DRAFT_53254 [Polychaeton citri CBS 116435]